MSEPEQGGAAAADKRPSQILAERLLAARDVLARVTDTLEDVLASVHGRPRPQPERQPASGTAPDYRRFFPAVDRLATDIEGEAKRLQVLAEGFDKAF